MKEVSIYVASTIRGSRRQDGYIGYVLEYYAPDRKYPWTLYDYEKISDMNCNCAILEALIRALARLREKCILSVYTESGYLYHGFGGDALTDRWQKNGWKTTQNTEVKNRDKWEALIRAFRGPIYQFYLNESNAYMIGLNADLKMLEQRDITLDALKRKRQRT